MTSAYSVFANNGVRQDPSWFIRIEDSKGKVIDEYKDRSGKRVLDPQIAYLMSNVLSDDSSRAEVFGAGGPLTLKGRPVAAKTGTTNDYKDAWTMGYTPSLVTGVWVGNNDGTKMTQAGGSIAAAPIWHDYMTKALEGTKVEQFQKPSGVKTVTLDAIRGRRPLTGSPTVTDVFPSWYKLPDVIGGAQTYKIDKATGKLASDKCPAELTQTVTTGNPVTAEIPSSDPAYSRWFAPIAAWAQGAGYPVGTVNIPTEYSDCGITGTDKPTVSITSPSSGATVKSTFNVGISVDAAAGIQSVKVSLGSVTVDATEAGDGYVATFTNVPDGDYELVATVKDKKYQSATSETVTITVRKK
jgi:membrane peptidoglycan carboxypeptidase